MSIADMIRANLATKTLSLIINAVNNSAADFNKKYHNLGDFSTRLATTLKSAPTDYQLNYYVLSATNEEMEHITDIPERLIHPSFNRRRVFERFTSTNDTHGLRGMYSVGDDDIRVMLFVGLSDDHNVDGASNLHSAIDIYIPYYGHEHDRNMWTPYFKPMVKGDLTAFQERELAVAFAINMPGATYSDYDGMINNRLKARFHLDSVNGLTYEQYSEEHILGLIRNFYVALDRYLTIDGAPVWFDGAPVRAGDSYYYEFPLSDKTSKLLIGYGGDYEDSYLIYGIETQQENATLVFDQNDFVRALCRYLVPNETLNLPTR